MTWLMERLAYLGGMMRRLWRAVWAWFGERRLALIGSFLLLILLLYYLGGMAVMNRIDDRMPIDAGAELLPGGSQAVANSIHLLDREINRNGWTANDPWFMPSALLDNMPAYQQGLRQSLSQFVLELRDQIGRTRGSSAADPDLETAVSKINYQGDIWIVHGLTPRQRSESAYREAIAALRRYQQRVATGEAVYERRADNLLATLDRLSLDLGSASAALDQRIRQHSNDLIDFHSDDLFYDVKGRAYAVYWVMDGLEADYARLINDRDLKNVWDGAKESLAEVIALDPLIVANGEIDGQILPNHLAAAGFYLMRARTHMREVTNILLK